MMRKLELDQAMRLLPARTRQVITLHFLHGYTFSEAGTRSGLGATRAREIAAEGFRSMRTMLHG